GPQREPVNQRDVVVPGDGLAAARTAAARPDDAVPVRQPGDDHVEEAPRAGAQHEGVGVGGERERTAHEAGAEASCARFTKRLSSESRCGETETSVPPAPTITRMASWAGCCEEKSSTRDPSRLTAWAPCFTRASSRAAGTPCATISTARTPGSRSDESV